jgi:formylglycine-generating enzyme required for sulfatase activity/transposase-like protein
MLSAPQDQLSDEQKSALVECIIRGKLTPQQACQRHGLSSTDLKDWVRIYRREARRAFDDRVKTALSTHGMDVDDLSPAEFSGNVEEMAIAELIQTIEFGRKDAEIRIELGGELSRIWCVQGDVVDAETGLLMGAPAVYRLLSLEHGRVQADFAPVQRERRITVSTQALLMESARRYDECQQLFERIGDRTQLYVPSARSLSPDVQATPEEFAVLRLFDGVRTLDEVVLKSHLPDLETVTFIARLLAQHLLEPIRASRTSIEVLPTVTAIELPEMSFLPLAASLGVRAEPRAGSRRWVWGVAAVGSATLGAAFALRFADEQQAAARVLERERSKAAAAPLVAATPLALAPPTCPEGTALLDLTTSGDVAAARQNGLAWATDASRAPLCMAKHEVTLGQYEKCRTEGACDSAQRAPELPDAQMGPEMRKRAQSALGEQCNAGQAGRDNHPVNCVTFSQAEKFCAWSGGRLPSAREWEHAARGKAQRTFPWGDGPPGAAQLNGCGSECQAWYDKSGLTSVFGGTMYASDDGYAGTAPVGSFPAGASPDGILDLLGNVAEWTSERVPFDGAEGEGGAEASAGEATAGEAYVVVGGAFSSGGDALHAPALRQYVNAASHAQSVGFRCVFSLANAGASRFPR